MRLAGGPPPCSPKSMCYLAGKVPDLSFEVNPSRNYVHQLSLRDLEDTAQIYVNKRTSATNVVRETFSKSTAR